MRIKSKAASRRHLSAVERLGLLNEYHRSQLTQREFAGQCGVSLATLARWLREEREAPPARQREDIPFAELPLAQVAGPARWSAELVRPDGGTLRVAADAPAALVAQLLGAC